MNTRIFYLPMIYGAVLLLCLTTVATAQITIVNVDYGCVRLFPVTPGSPPPPFSGGSTWNDGCKPFNSFFDTDLVDSNGISTEVDYSITSNSNVQAASTENSAVNDVTVDYARSSNFTNFTLKISDLETSSTYDLILFGYQAFSSVPAELDGQGTKFTIDGVTKTSDATFTSGFAEGSTHVVFTDLAPNANGEIVVAMAPEQGDAAFLNGRQLREVPPPADLSLTKTESQDPVNPGAQLIYTITVANGSPNEAIEVILSDTLPSGVTLVCLVPSQGGCTTLPCNLGTIAGGDSATVTMTVTVDATDGILTNTATVTSLNDPNSTNNSEVTETQILALPADLSLAKIGFQGPVSTGAQLTYILKVDNAGPGDAFEVTVSDTFPTDAVTLEGVLSSQGGCTSLPCDLGTIGNGDAAVVALTVRVDAIDGTFTNTASVTSDSNDPNLLNNSAEVETQVLSADLSVTKIDSKDPVSPGEEFTYTLTVSNAGPSDAFNVYVSDKLPPGIELLSVTSPQSDCTGLPCIINHIANGDSATLEITVRVAVTGGILRNTASVAISDPNPNNNTATEETEVPGLTPPPPPTPFFEWVVAALIVILAGAMGFLMYRKLRRAKP